MINKNTMKNKKRHSLFNASNFAGQRNEFSQVQVSSIFLKDHQSCNLISDQFLFRKEIGNCASLIHWNCAMCYWYASQPMKQPKQIKSAEQPVVSIDNNGAWVNELSQEEMKR